MTEFSVRLEVRIYEIDPQLHLGGASYIQYADQSRYACLRAAGVDVDDLLTHNLGPVNLETSIKYLSELRGGDQVDVSCRWEWGTGKTYRVLHELRHADGRLAAEVAHTSGLLDLKARRLVASPATEWRSRATHPDLLGM
ncbi:acyl-CoA thioesterase [Actinomadura barringtoniae]|uniref:Acyl-CoA thioesterase n=1 Tax=Actinomadura barringtoniae TaxID=1427535 RepID=A0A939PKF8_9ACTN|nr:acyl-CoA thioesterase [Actinomadura barringtoniae]MBO2451728.1 acyl-CoA thioesterase [Actinomadura barringtoniae]